MSDEQTVVGRVVALSGESLDVTDPVLAERLAPGVRVIRQNRGVFDAAPLSLTTSQTVTALDSSARHPSLEPPPRREPHPE